MRALALVSLIAIAFGVGSFYATAGPDGRATLDLFGWVNLAGGALALVAAAVLAARRTGGFGSSAARRVLVPRLLWVVVTIVAVVGLERAVDATRWRFDWTRDERFEIAPALRETILSCPAPLRATLYEARFDPRSRRTRFLLDSLADVGRLDVRRRVLENALDEAEHFGVQAPDSVVLEIAHSFALVERPTQGSLLQTIQRLCHDGEAILYLALGEGEGDPTRGDARGFSGLGFALESEGYELRRIIPAAIDAIPGDADVLVFLGPERGLTPGALAAVRAYLARGGRLVALLEPGSESGLETVLEEYGIRAPAGILIDAASGPIEGAPPGVNLIVGAFSEHEITRPLPPSAMGLLLGVRALELGRKPEPGDRIETIAFSSPRAWVSPDVDAVERGYPPEPPNGSGVRRYAVMATGRYPRAEGEARIVAIGDRDFANNAYARSVYNLDLILNAVHWAAERQTAVTLRPKLLTPDQDPLPPQTSLEMLYRVGLLVPELLLMEGALVWSRQRSA